MTKDDVLKTLSAVIHPEYEADIVSLGMVENLQVDDAGDVNFNLVLRRGRDPLAASVKRQCEQALGGRVRIIIKEPAPAAKQAKEKPKASEKNSIGRVIAIASGKGGVGKSTVTANLAVALAVEGYRVGVLDADIYGPSMPKMFGVEGYAPPAEGEPGHELILPAESFGVKVMSIGFFIKPDDALVWRGPMATNALRQLAHQTAWGELDYLLIDLPPGTGDVHLTITSELKVDGAIVVSTPQQVAVADVVRGIRMFRELKIPVLGIIENMAWFTPAELPQNRYYIFGRDGAKEMAQSMGIPLLGQIPLVQSISYSGDNGIPVASTPSITAAAFADVAGKLSGSQSIKQ